jgi:16S rRNA (adenine1518-N6/adenine1519-N6)-dimethyltransferase
MSMTENPYIALPRIRAALRALDLRPSKGMGQNFLIDSAALDTILEAADLTQGQTVIEVGPGFGVLTWELVRRAGEVISVELDKRLVARLREEFANAANLTIVESDILRIPPEEILSRSIGPSHFQGAGTSAEDPRPKTRDRSAEFSKRDGDPPAISDQRPARDNHRSSIVHHSSPTSHRPYNVIANLPYAITSPVLRHFLEAGHKPGLMVILVQWEVAQRIAARVGDLSVLAHAIQIYAEPEIVARVQARSFYPSPAVDSAVLRLRVRPQPAADVDSVDALMRVIKAGFLHARKTLSNSLPGGLAAMGRPTTREEALAALNAAGIDPQRRAETLALEEWVDLYRAFKS